MKKVIVVGGHEQACNTTNYLIENNLAKVVLIIARKDDEGEDGVFPSLLKVSRNFDIPSLKPNSLNSNSVIQVVKTMDADLVLSLQNNMLFSSDWIKLFENKLGIVNIHYSPLPKYSGYWPEMWAIWNCEENFGVTMHYVSDGIDTGPIINQKFFKIIENETRFSLYKKSGNACFELIKQNLPKILIKKQKTKIQDKNLRTYFKKSLPNNGILDLSWDSEKKSRFIRAISFPGFPGPKIKIGENTYTILQEDMMFFKSYLLN